MKISQLLNTVITIQRSRNYGITEVVKPWWEQYYMYVFQDQKIIMHIHVAVGINIHVNNSDYNKQRGNTKRQYVVLKK